MDSDFNSDIFSDNFPSSSNNNSAFKVIGAPLITCSSFVVLLEKAYEKRRCKACLSVLKFPGEFYCSEKCCIEDRHRDKLDKFIHSSMDVLMTNFKDYEEFMTESFFISLNKLFLRVLYTGLEDKDQSEVERYHESFFSNIQRYKEITHDLDIDEFGSPSFPIDKLQTYLGDYDLLSEKERCAMDIELNMNIPGDDYFLEEHIKRQVTVTVNSLLNAVEETLESSNNRSYNLSSFDDEIEYGISPENQLVPLDFSQYFSNVFSQSTENSQNPRLQNSLKIYRQQNVNFETAEIQFDILNEEKAIALHKKAIRMIVLDFLIFHSEQTDSGRSKEDNMYGDWLRTLRDLIKESPEIRTYFERCSWNDFVRAFYVTIRYNVGIQDFLCSNNIAIGIYLPLIGVEHSCKPNCSLVFNDREAKLFYKPKKEIVIEQNNKCRTYQYDSNEEIISDSNPKSLEHYLPLEDSLKKFSITLDYQSHLLFRTDKRYLEKLAEFRLLKCLCNECKDLNVLTDYDEMMDIEEDDCVFSQDDFSSNQYDNPAEQIYNEVCQYLNFIMDAGNNDDLRYFSKIQPTIEDVISNARELIGFYHPRISGFLFYSLCSKFHLILHEIDNVILFYKYLFIDKILLGVMNSILITNGKNHPVISVLKKVHKLCHNNMSEFYVEIEDKLKTIEPKMNKKLSLGMMSLNNCHNLLQTKFIVEKINWEHGLLYDYERGIIHLDKAIENSNYEPDVLLPNYHSQGRKRKISETETLNERKSANDKNKMNFIFLQLDSVFNISDQHYL